MGAEVYHMIYLCRNICICALCHIINSIFATPAGFVSLKLVHIPAGLKTEPFKQLKICCLADD